AIVIAGGEQSRVCLYDMENKCVTWSVPAQIANSSSPAFLASDDGRWLVIADTNTKTDPPVDDVPWTGTFMQPVQSERELFFRCAEVWDLRSKRKKLQLGGGGDPPRHLILPRRGSQLAVWTKKKQEFALSLIDLDADDDKIARALLNPLRIAHD